MNKFGHIFISWIKMRLPVAAIFALGAGVFAVISVVQNLPAEPVVYALVLAGALAVGCGIYDFLRFRSKHLTLVRMQQNITDTLNGLPPCDTLIEQDYARLVTQLFTHALELTAQAEKRRTDQTDYYTMWAHQIKTPLAAMRLIVHAGTCDVPTLEQELFKTEQYVEMVLQYMRLESISEDFILAKYPLDRIVREAVKKQSTAFIYKKITLVMEVPPTTVLTDEKWLGFVLEQLLSNSLKYTREGGRITICLSPERKDTLLISDTGIGIRPEDLSRVFDRGFTGYNGRMNKKSTGIGLYLCKRVLQRLHHPIEITSQVGKGTTVAIDFAANQQQALAGPQE